MFEGLAIASGVAAALTQALQSGRLSHAVILEGADSETRLRTAKALAKGLVCTGNSSPCGVCRACKKSDADSHPDIHLLQKEDSAAFIKVDAVRALKEQASLLPNDGDAAVFIIHEAQTMNVQAQNALLKIFEEPASYIHFLLTCDSKASLLETIRSRAVSYSLSAEASSQMPAQLSEKAQTAGTAFLRALCSGNELDLLKAGAVFQKDKPLLQAALPLMTLVLRDALVFQTTAAPMGPDPALANAMRQGFSPEKLLRLVELTNDTLTRSKANANQNLTVTALCAAFSKIKAEP